MKKGSKMSVEARLKIKEHNLRTGKRPPSRAGIKHTEEWKRNMSRMMKGRVFSEETLAKRRASVRRGPDSHFWKGGVTTEVRRLRASLEYRQWRGAVFERDKYTCQGCGEQGGRLNADHIKRFADYPELRFDVNNGRTLCEECHKKTPTFGRWGVRS